MNNKDKVIKQESEKSAYIASLSEKLVDAIEDVFGATSPTPTGNDMIDALSLASVFVFSNQIRKSCNSKKTMQSVLKSTVWALQGCINTFAAPLLEDEKTWEKYFGKREEGGENEQS